MTELDAPIPQSATPQEAQQQASGSASPNIPQSHNGIPPQQEMDHAELERARAANEQALRDSREGVWFLKEITFNGQRKKIVTQNYNGPCSFIAICNILILRGDIEILPPDRMSVSYDIVAQLVVEYLLHASPDVDLSAALTMMPLTQKGMDLNPLFTSPSAFHPHGDNGALKLFEQANIPLVHGWLADPHMAEYSAVARIKDYDSAVNLIVEADTLAKGQLVMDENAPGPSESSSTGAGQSGYGAHAHVGDNWSEEDRRKVEDALVLRHFLESTSSQLTYHGLFTLASAIQPGSLVALFRNSHLSVLYRRPLPPSSSAAPVASSSSAASSSRPSTTSALNQQAQDTDPDPEADYSLYNLVTDFVFHNEPSVVWERLEDIDGASSTFVDSEFRRSAPVGGDFAGASVRDEDPGAFADYDPADVELARALQAEEDAKAQEAYARRAAGAGRVDPRDPGYAAYMQQREYIQRQVQLYGGGRQGQGQAPAQTQAQGGGKPFKVKRKRSCVIM